MIITYVQRKLDQGSRKICSSSRCSLSSAGSFLLWEICMHSSSTSHARPATKKNGGMSWGIFDFRRDSLLIFFRIFQSDYRLIFSLSNREEGDGFYNSILSIRTEFCSHTENRILFSADEQKFYFADKSFFFFFLNLWIQNSKL